MTLFTIVTQLVVIADLFYTWNLQTFTVIKVELRFISFSTESSVTLDLSSNFTSILGDDIGKNVEVFGLLLGRKYFIFK